MALRPHSAREMSAESIRQFQLFRIYSPDGPKKIRALKDVSQCRFISHNYDQMVEKK